ncbi:VP5 [Kummerowia striata gokushovirus]|nr:VP5 [Kummerowia striata gokushovirus]
MDPMFFVHSGQAERTWVELCNAPDTLMAKHPADFTLFQVGEFDDETGALQPLGAPVQLMTAVAAKKDSGSQSSLPFERK